MSIRVQRQHHIPSSYTKRRDISRFMEPTPKSLDDFTLRKFPLPLTTGAAAYVQLDLRDSTNPTLLCFAMYNDIKPRFEVQFGQGADMVNNITETGPCIYIMSVASGDFEFQLVRGASNIGEWIKLFTSIGVTLLSFDDIYTFTKVVGEGSFGKVSVGHHKPTGATVCLKSIQKTHQKIFSVYHEISIMRRVSHPNVVQLYASYEDDVNVHMVMEYCAGGEVFDYLQKHGSYSEANAREVIKKVIAALEYLHGIGIVHRDLKTENLLLTHANEPTSVKLIDFGLSAVMQEGTNLKMRCGSPGFVAPEILNADIRGYGTVSDMFGCGALLFTLITGVCPFKGNDAKEIMRKNSRCVFSFSQPIWDNISNGCKDLICWLMQRSPSGRCTATEALRHAWMQEDDSSSWPYYSIHLKNQRCSTGVMNSGLIASGPESSIQRVSAVGNPRRIYINSKNTPPQMFAPQQIHRQVVPAASNPQDGQPKGFFNRPDSNKNNTISRRDPKLGGKRVTRCGTAPHHLNVLRTSGVPNSNPPPHCPMQNAPRPPATSPPPPPAASYENKGTPGAQEHRSRSRRSTANPAVGTNVKHDLEIDRTSSPIHRAPSPPPLKKSSAPLQPCLSISNQSTAIPTPSHSPTFFATPASNGGNEATKEQAAHVWCRRSSCPAVPCTEAVEILPLVEKAKVVQNPEGRIESPETTLWKKLLREADDDDTEGSTDKNDDSEERIKDTGPLRRAFESLWTTVEINKKGTDSGCDDKAEDPNGTPGKKLYELQDTVTSTSPLLTIGNARRRCVKSTIPSDERRCAASAALLAAEQKAARNLENTNAANPKIKPIPTGQKTNHLRYFLPMYSRGTEKAAERAKKSAAAVERTGSCFRKDSGSSKSGGNADTGR
eukprot:GHVO01016499.1.p1 GENE.GHVO01016499.1~~GHVO01016499.1.p1  ORF type:complete len:889 (+),score=142.89 GHVO01016499.1:1900-4566(+)